MSDWSSRERAVPHCFKLASQPSRLSCRCLCSKSECRILPCPLISFSIRQSQQRKSLFSTSQSTWHFLFRVIVRNRFLCFRIDHFASCRSQNSMRSSQIPLFVGVSATQSFRDIIDIGKISSTFRHQTDTLPANTGNRNIRAARYSFWTAVFFGMHCGAQLPIPQGEFRYLDRPGRIHARLF